MWIQIFGFVYGSTNVERLGSATIFFRNGGSMNEFMAMNFTGLKITSEKQKEQLTLSRYDNNTNQVLTVIERERNRKDMMTYVDMLNKTDRLSAATVQRIKDKLRQSVLNAFSDLEGKTHVVEPREFEFVASDGRISPVEKRKRMVFDD